mmetsp:Transcript_459/g.851  ORF Transcript_459/g.851 Transcript_459/m.851 type:complete len:290 (-) Transcript_459:1090-1959(-)
MADEEQSPDKNDLESIPQVASFTLSKPGAALGTTGHGGFHEHEHAHGGHSHGHGDEHGHGHSHEILEGPGRFLERERPQLRSFQERAFTVGIGGPVGSGKTALVRALCGILRDEVSLGVVTNDIFTREDAEFLIRHRALEEQRIVAVETGGCPHAAVREDISANVVASEQLTRIIQPDIIFIESGGDNLAANFSRELADLILYVIDVSGGDKIPRKGGPGVTQSDLLIINKIDLAEAVGSSLEVMERDAKRMRNNGPIIFTQCKNGDGIKEVGHFVLQAWQRAVGRSTK